MATPKYNEQQHASQLQQALAKVGVNVKAGQPAAPGKAQQRAADFRAGVKYTPHFTADYNPNAAFPQRAAVQAQAPAFRAPQQAQGPMQGPMSTYRAPQQPQGPMSTYRAPVQPYAGPSSNATPMGAYGGNNQWQPPSYHADPIGALQSWQPQAPGVAQNRPSQDQTNWMMNALWTLAGIAWR